MLGTVLAATLVVSGCGVAQKSNQGGQGQGQGQGQGKQQAVDYKVDSSDILQKGHLIEGIELADVDEQEKAGLILMREEEKLARDVYLALEEKWGLKVFGNIAQSEQSHTDAVKELLDRYGIEDPVKDDAIGAFTSKEMQELYGQLLERGSKSQDEALQVGALIEDLDIKDLEELIAQTDNEDIKIVYDNLTRGSRNHMRAFIRNIERNGGEYKPQYINQKTFEGIIQSDQESGGGSEMGPGRNR